MWLGDWFRLGEHLRAVFDLPAPAGPAGPCSHQTLRYCQKGAGEPGDSLLSGNTAGRAQAMSDLAARDRAAHLFSQAMGLTSPTS